MCIERNYHLRLFVFLIDWPQRSVSQGGDGPTGVPASTEELLAVIAAQQAQIDALLAKVAELERRLGLNSSKSGKPPPRDGPKKPSRTGILRSRLGNKPDGRRGHSGETLR
jgi:hypothetical protein